MKKIFELLFKEFIKKYGRKPNNLENILLKQKATKQALDQRKVLDLKGNPIDPSKPIIGGKNVKLTHKEKIDWLVKNVDPKAEQTIPPKATLEAMLKGGREDLIDHFFKMHTKKIGSKPQIKIDTSDLKHPELVAGIIRATKQKPTLATTKGISDRAFKDQHLSFRLNIAKNSREFNQDLANKIIKREIYKDFSDVQRKQFLDDLTSVLKEPLAGGGIAGMLGEPTYSDGGRIGFKKGSWSKLKKKYKGSTLQAILDNPQLMAAELGHEGIFSLLQMLGMKEGGRVRYDKGKKVDLSKRKFLKGTGAAVGVLSMLPFVGKFFKPAAKAVKSLTSVPITQTADMPSWFPSLVNRIIKEGDDVTKQYATVERQIVHKTQLPESKTEVLLTQDLNTGDVAVDIGLSKHGFADGHLGQPIRLEYKASEVIEPTISKKGKVTHKGGKTEPEFNIEEAEFTGDAESVKFEESTLNKYGEQGSDLTEVEGYARAADEKTGVVPKLYKESGLSGVSSEKSWGWRTKKGKKTRWEQERAEARAEEFGDEFASGGIAGQLHLNQGGRVSFTKGGKVSSGLSHILGV